MTLTLTRPERKLLLSLEGGDSPCQGSPPVPCTLLVAAEPRSLPPAWPPPRPSPYAATDYARHVFTMTLTPNP